MTDLDPALREEASALQTHLGYMLTGWQAGWARIELPLRPEIMNRQGLPHGGIHATLLDTAMGYSGCYTGDPAQKQLALTLSLNVNFLSRPARDARGLVAEASQTGGGTSSFFAQGRVRDDTGHVVAEGSGVFRYRKGSASAP